MVGCRLAATMCILLAPAQLHAPFALERMWRCVLRSESISFRVGCGTMVFKSAYYLNTMGAFLVTDNRVFNGPLGRSLHLFTRTAHSAHLLRSLALQRSTLLCLLCYIRFATFALLHLLCYTRFTTLALLSSLGPFTGLLTHFTHSILRYLNS